MDDLVTQVTPTAVEARATLAEAAGKAAVVHRADRELRWLLVGVAATYVLTSAVAGAAGRKSELGFAVVVAIVLCSAAAMIVVGLRIRVYSRSGYRW